MAQRILGLSWFRRSVVVLLLTSHLTSERAQACSDGASPNGSESRRWIAEAKAALDAGDAPKALAILNGHRLMPILQDTSHQRKQAQSLLEKLLARGLLIDAEEIVLLARLREQSGDAAGARRLLERCRKLAQLPAQCAEQVSPAPASHASQPSREPPRSDRSADLDAMPCGPTDEKDALSKRVRHGLPEQLSKTQVLKILKPLKLSPCKQAGASGVVTLKLTLNPDGKVSVAVPSAADAASECVSRVVQEVRFPRFSGEPMSFSFPFILR